MGADDDKSSVDYLEVIKAVGRRIRNIFLLSVSLSVFICVVFVLLVLLRGSVPHVVRVSFPAILLWSFVVTGYAFHCQWRLAVMERLLLEDDTVTDFKTGVKSLSYIGTVLQKEYERMIQTGQPAAVLYVDLENLDIVNQSFGHAIGDIVLANVAKVVESNVPGEGVVGHVAGDEFVVVLPATKLEKAKSVAAAIERGIRDYRMDYGKKGTVDFLDSRIGIIACPKEGGIADEIIGIAQQAAAQAKANAGPAASIRSKVRRAS